MHDLLKIEREAREEYHNKLMGIARKSEAEGSPTQSIIDMLHHEYLRAVNRTDAKFLDPESTAEQRATLKGYQTGALDAMTDFVGGVR